jgi:Viral BACON domain
MQQAIGQHLIVTYAISLGFTTALLSLFQPIHSASAQQLTAPVGQDTSGTGIQGQRIETIAPTLPYPIKSLEKKDSQTSTRKPHRLIRKPQNAPVASVELSPSAYSPVRSLPTPLPSLQSDNATVQSKEPSSLNGSVGAAVPLTSMSVAPSSATATGSGRAATSTTTGTIPLAAAGAGNSSTSGSGGASGRSIRSLAAEMPGLAQLISPPSVPVVSVPPSIGASPASLAFVATQGGANPATQTVSISNTGGGALSWTASDNAAWLSLSSASGTGNGTLTASVNTGGLATGTYTGTITVAANGVTSRTVSAALTVNAPASSSVTLTWNANTESDLAGYKVYRATASGAYAAPIATLTGNVTNYAAMGLQVGTTYFFVVTAYDNAGNESSMSNEVNKSIF